MSDDNKEENKNPGVETPPIETKKEGNVPVDVYENTKTDMLKYKEQRNGLQTTNQELQTKLDKFEAEKKESADKKLLEDGEYKELAEKKQKEIDDLMLDKNSNLINSEIKFEALKLGAIDANDVIKLIDTAEIKVNESGVVEGVSEAMKTFSEAKPNLFGTVPTPGSTPLNIDTKKPGVFPVDKAFEDLKGSELMAMKKENPDLYKKLETDHDLKYGTKSPL